MPTRKPTTRKPATKLARKPASTGATKSESKSAKLALVGSPATTEEVSSQPSVRMQRVWTAGQIRMVQFAADSGDMYALGDLCDQMLADDRIGELLETLATLVLGCDLSYEQNPGSKVGDAPKAAEIEIDFPIGWPEDELKNLICWRELIGIGWARHEKWFESDEQRLLPKTRAWHPKHFAFDDRRRIWTVRDDRGQRIDVLPGQGEWIAYTRRGDFRPWGAGLWRGLSKWWMLKQYAMSDWGVHSEKGSKLVLEAPEGVQPEMRVALANEVYQLAKDAVISLPAGFKMSLIELTANTRDIYQAQIDAADMGFAIAILGQNLTSRVDGGSYSATTSHERKENKRANYISKSLSQVLYAQSLPWWAEYNFGDRAFTPYPRWETDPPEDKGEKVATLSTLATALATLQTAGYKLPPALIEEQYGIKLFEMSPGERAALLPANTQRNGQTTPSSPTTPGTPRAPTRRPSPQLPAAARASRGHKMRLASGDAPESAPGFVEGQDYVDQLIDASVMEASDLLAPFIGRIEKAVAQATDYDSVRAAILQAFEDEEDADLLEELVEHGIVMANLAGRHAVQVDLDAEPDKGGGNSPGEGE